jgi:tetratricopeptide (TPR) repeat protein
MRNMLCRADDSRQALALEAMADSLVKSFGAQADRSKAVERARLALQSDRPQDAEQIADEILKHDPHYAQALHIRGCVLLMRKRFADAIAPLEAAALSLRDPETDTLLAMALREVGRHDEALARLRRLTRRRPRYAPAFRELGYLLMVLEQFDEAIEALGCGLEIAPMMPQLWTQLGNVFLRRRNYAEAKSAFARALEISPASSDALFGMAKTLHSLGEYSSAVDYYRRCLRATPEEAVTWLGLGHCLLALGELEAGYDCFRTAARGDAKRPGRALTSLAASGRGRLWLRPSAATRFFSPKRQND